MLTANVPIPSWAIFDNNYIFSAAIELGYRDDGRN